MLAAPLLDGTEMARSADPSTSPFELSELTSPGLQFAPSDQRPPHHPEPVATLWLSAFIFFLAFKPSEPHLTAYLTRVKGFSEDAVNDDIYTVWTYAYFGLMLLVAACFWLLPCVLRARTRLAPRTLSLRGVVWLGVCGRVATRFLLLFGTSLASMQLMQATYAAGSVTEALFPAYVLAVTRDNRRYIARTAITQHAYLISHVVSGVLGDVLLHFHIASLRGLMYISAISVCVAALIAFVKFPAPTGPTPPAPVAPDERELAPPGVSANACSAHASGLPEQEPPLLVAVAESGGMGVVAFGPDLAVESVDARLLLRLLREPLYLLLAVWWMLSSVVYQSVYGYETSLYSALEPSAAQDWNGSWLAAALLVSSVSVGIPALPRVNAALSPSLRRSAVFFGACGVLGTCGVVTSGCSSHWWLALCGIVVWFGCWAPANALFVSVTGQSIMKQHCTGRIGDSCTVCPALMSFPEHESTAQHLSRPLLQAPAPRTEVSLHMFGPVFSVLSTLSLAVQTLVQYVIYTDLNMPVPQSFRVWAWVLGAATCFLVLSLCLVRR